MKSTAGTLLVLTLLTAVGWAVRVDRIRGPEGSLLEDEARLVLAAKGVIATGLPTMPSGKLYFRGVVNSYLTAVSVKVFGQTDFASRLPNTVMGVLLVPLLFLFGRALGGRVAGLGAASFAVAQPELVRWSASAWMTSLFVVVFVGATYLLYLGFERDRARMQIAGAAMLVVATLTHELGALLAGALVVTLALRLVARDFHWFHGPRTIVALGLVALGAAVFVGLGLQLRAATIAGAGGEFSFYFGPSLSPERFLIDLERWRTGYLPMLIAGLAGAIFFLRGRGADARFLHVTMAVTGFTVWVVIQKESERYGLVLLPLLALLAAWGVAQTVRFVGERWRMSERAGQVMMIVAVGFTFGVSFVRDARDAMEASRQAPAPTWLTEFRSLGPSPEDLIMSGDPEIPALYLGRVDYWERGRNFERYAYRDGELTRHLYTGAVRIATEDDFRALLSSEPARTLWYVGRFGASTYEGALRRAADLVHRTAGEEFILKIPLGSGRKKF